MKNDVNEIYEKRAKRFLIIAIILIPSISYFLIRLSFSGDICTEKAKKIVGDNWNQLIKPTEEESKYTVGEDIALGFRETLKCEREFRYLIP